MKKYLTKKYIGYGAIALVAIIIIVSVASGRGGKNVETITVAPGPFSQQVSVSGKVVAAQSVDLAFTQSGRVSQVYARVGDVVARGKVLAALENADLWADVLQREATVDAEKAKLVSLEGGTRQEQIDITESSVTAARVSRDQAIEALSDEIKNAYTQSDDAVRRRTDQFITNPRSSSPQLTFTVDAVLEASIEWQRYLVEGVLVSWKSSIDTTLSTETLVGVSQKNLNTVLSLLNDVATAVNTLGANASLSQTTVDGYRSDITTARANINAAVASLTQAVTAKKNAEADLMTAEKRLTLEQAGTDSGDILVQQARVQAAEADVLSARARYQKTLVVAPFTGTITKMDAKVGGIASANVSAISMISTGKLQIESYIPEINAPLVSVGDRATVTLDAYGTDAPFAASVVSIDPAETIRDGVTTYRAILEFTNQDPRIKAGMTANVVITTEEKTATISVPQGTLTKRNGKTFVLVIENELVMEREVVAGSFSSLGTVEIVSGLVPGDLVVIEQK